MRHRSQKWHIKSLSLFIFFANFIPSSHIPNLSDFLRIAGSIINKYHKNMMFDADLELAEQMLNQNEVNTVQTRVEPEHSDKGVIGKT